MSDSGETVTVLVTGSGGPLGVNVTRSLRDAEASLRIVGTDANRWHLPLSETDQTYLIPYARDRHRYAAAIREIAAREGVAVLLPTHPVEVRAIAELRDAGALGELAVALPQTTVLDVCDSKLTTYEALLQAGIPVPRTVLLQEAADAVRAFDEFGGGERPVWVRGTGAPGLGIGGAALPCRKLAVAIAWIEHHDGWGKMAASEYLPGANLSWMGGFADGALIASGCRERLEYVLPHVSPSGITGAPAVSRTIEDPRVAAIGEQAVRAVDGQPHGVYFVDLKGDSDGAPRVTEINAGRCGTTVRAYTEAGYNFPWMLVELALGRQLAPQPDAIAPDVYWVRTLDCGPVALRGERGFHEFPVVGVDE